jgi:dolichyl-phosphate-mannose-protein mannosyltransferase
MTRLFDEPGTWQKKDWLILAGFAFISLLLLLIRLNHPNQLVFDEHWYARDGCWYVLSSRPQCDLTREILVDKNVPIFLRDFKEVSPEQPPLGKWLIGAGVWLFGMHFFSLRLAPIGCGMAAISLLYVLAYKLFRSRTAAIVAAGLLTFDFLHFVQARLAMLDIFVAFFGVAAYLFCVLDRAQIIERRNGGASRNRFWSRKWRLAAGLAAGAAAASKLSGWFVVVGVFLLVIAWEIHSRRSEGLGRAIVRAFREEAGSIGLALVGLPLFVYAASYTGRLEGTILTWPWASDSWFRALIDRQFFMIEFHSRAVRARQTPSTFFLPTLFKPLLYSQERYGDLIAPVLVFGNPFVWWPAFIALPVVAWRWIHLRKMGQPEGLILSGFLANYASWLMMTWARPQVMIHYFTQVTPFASLMAAYLIAITSPAKRPLVAGLLLGTAGLMFAFYFPALTAIAMSPHTLETYTRIANFVTRSR